MESYLTEIEAKQDILTAIKETVDDFKLYAYARNQNKSRVVKNVTFVVVVKQSDDCEHIFNSLSRLGINSGGKINNISSTAQLNESKRQIEDIFKLDVSVKAM